MQKRNAFAFSEKDSFNKKKECIIIIIIIIITITDSNKLERVQRKFAAFCHKIFVQDVEYHYDNI
jgi:hypothetical protein